MIKLYDSEFLQVYKFKNLSYQKNYKYEYYYRLIDFSTRSLKIRDKINVYLSNTFPYELIHYSCGFLFISSKVKKNELLKFPKSDFKMYKTELKDLSNQFIGTKYNLILKIKPALDCNPKCSNDLILGYNINEENVNDVINKSEILKQFRKLQTIKNFNELINYIKSNCPISLHPSTEIDEDSFKKQISEKDYAVEFDIKDSNEIRLIYEIEHIFEDLNQIVRVYNNYNDIYHRIKSKCDELKLEYKTAESSKPKHIKYSSDKDLGVVDWIELKYSDLEKCKLTYTLTDFIS